MSRMPSFESFYQAVHGRAPFPWQCELAERVLEKGWPELLDLPTGAGKTSALDVAVYTLAAKPAELPRRTVLVVDRRIVVDQGAQHARRLREALMKAKDGAAATVAAKLRELWGGKADDPPFAVATLRGGMPRDNDWAKRPDIPVLGVSTIDQVGSRLLFRGYGVSALSAAIHAGLLGNDTLILLDEVHLATAFAETLEALRERWIRPVEVHGLPDRFAVVQMSATPGKPVRGALRLGPEDRKHPALRPRLRAKKPAQLVTVEVRGDSEAGKREAVAEQAVKHARRLQEEGAKVVGVVVNRVDTARQVWQTLGEGAILLTGRMRPIDRDRVVREQLERAEAGRDRAKDQPLVVVATQCIEAGADLDFDALVTECASLDALRQRFGRLDRRGEVTEARESAAGVILCRSDLAAGREEDPVYGEALAATWKWLQAQGKKGVVGFGIEELVPPEGEELEKVLTRRERAPVLMPSQLDAWSHTSPILEPTPDPEISLWLHGPERGTAEVQVIWRADLQGRSESELRDELEQVRPSALEALPLQAYAARAWLAKQRVAGGIGDALGESEQEEERRVDDKEGRAFLLVRRGQPARWCTAVAHTRNENASPAKGLPKVMLRAGDTVIVPSSYGGLNAAGTFDPDATEPVTDLGDLAQLRGRGRVTLRLRPEVLRVWGLDDALREAAPKDQGEEEDESASERRQRVEDWIDRWPSAAPPGVRDAEWQAMRREGRELTPKRWEGGTWFLLEKTSAAMARRQSDDLLGEVITEEDEGSFRSGEVSLKLHSRDVETWAERFAEHLGIKGKLAKDLALAAWLHDVGKADPRFQLLLVGGDEVSAALQPEPLAKSKMAADDRKARKDAQKRSGYPSGYRHEVLSLAMVEGNAALRKQAHDFDLVLHLVASHHGWCRPHAPPVEEGEALEVTLQHGKDQLAANTQHGKARLGSGVAQRYTELVRRYGWWGLAWLEAIVRLADHRASEQREQEAKR